MTSEKSFERLPKSVIPKHYSISLKPCLKQFVFYGTCTINLEVVQETDAIKLNAVDLKISKAIFRDQAKNEIVAKSIDILIEDQLLVLSFGSKLLIGNGELYLEFEGILNDKLNGFYRVKYTTPSGEERFGAATQFEATHARQAFPCWDEPAIKATFDVTLIVPKDRLALSNMNVISDKDMDENLREVKFATTPIMSTYIVAFVVGEYDFIEDRTSSGVLIRVYTPVGKKDQGKYALEASVKALQYFDEYFKIPYPLPKLDLIALADFASGAMENWGLITFREGTLLVDVENSSAINKQYVAIVVAHELSHQWFGNLVTMEWWTDLWLNEGFASFIEFLCVDFLFPDYNIWSEFVTSMLTNTLDLDALENSHPIEVVVGHPSKIREIFDRISYGKGASVIRMLHRYIGNENFQKGLNVYLKRYAYKNTQTKDLWQTLEQTSKKPIESVMSTWTLQKGFPVIKVSSTQDGQDRVLSLTQKKFTLAETDDPSQWKVPISFSSSANSNIKDILLETKTRKVSLQNIEADQWVKLNKDAVGFYRVHYEKDMLDKLLPAIANQSLKPLDRLNLQNDLFALVLAGDSSTLDILQLLESYTEETNYTVWYSIRSCLSKIKLLMVHLNAVPQFDVFCQNLFAKINSNLGWEAAPGESHMDTMLRSLVITSLVSAKDKATITEAQNLYEKHLSGAKVIPADLRSPVYRAVISTCDEKIFDRMIQLYKDTDLQEEKDRIGNSFGSAPTKELLQKVLEFSLSSHVRFQNTMDIITSVSLSSIGGELAWNFIKDNIDLILERFATSYLSNRIKFITENFASEEKAKEIEEFFVKHPWKIADRAIQQAVETIRLNARWLARDEKAILSFLNKYQ